jgi:8-oxo-dGTP pyrophosphatase MutT (NUDIX family)
MKIYFAASIRGGRDQAHIYPAVVAELKRHGTVLSEHFADQSLTAKGEDTEDDKFIHDRDMGWVLEADVVVAEVTQPSLGVGYEIGRAVENGKRVLCLYRPQEGKLPSRMLMGSDRVKVRAYNNVEEARKHIDGFFAEAGKKILTLVFVHDRGRVLLGRKKRGFGAGRWNGFGGKVDANETIEQGARRELREEAGIGTVAVERRGKLTFHFEGDPVALEVHVFRVRGHTGEPSESEEMEPRWFSEDLIPYDDMWPDDKYWFPIFLAGKRFEGDFWFDGDKTIARYELKEI